mmetsp:Transcript_99966/g.322243  ORF Transcript_99966/g.322243 Transcript_99966/m.322243 type:complete len:122 (+) Transcript_99966:65-430(+)
MAMVPAGQRSLSAASRGEAERRARGATAFRGAGEQHRRIDPPSAPRLRPASDPVDLPGFPPLETSDWPFVLEESATLEPAAEGMWCEEFRMFEDRCPPSSRWTLRQSTFCGVPWPCHRLPF